MFLKDLKWQLLLSGVLAVGIIACLISCASHERTALVIFLAVLLILYIAAINVWFFYYISKPIQELTASAARIADGRYGTLVKRKAQNEIGRLTDEINEMSEKIAISDKTTTEFISQISHELRTPLTAITGWSETLQYDPAIQGDSLRGVSIISKEAERLTSMVTDLLEFTRIQDGRFNLRIELCDITAEFEDALFTYGNLMKQAGVELKYDPPEYDIPLISCDPERLKQVFLNLLDNAAKHGGSGKAVEAAISSDVEKITITIRDHGPGIPAAELPHVKEKFYKGSSKNRGSGIGLAVCDEIISRHGGTLTVLNAEDDGCIVTIKLPILGN